MTWNDKAKTLTIEPSAPKGSVNVPRKASFKVQLFPGGVIKEIGYAEKHTTVSF